MQLSTLMKLPNWDGEVYFPDLSRNFGLKVADEGDKLLFRYNSATYFIYDQEVNISIDGGITVKVSPKNRFTRAMPHTNRIYILDRESRVILPSAMDKLLPSVPMQGYYGTVPRSLMA